MAVLSFFIAIVFVSMCPGDLRIIYEPVPPKDILKDPLRELMEISASVTDNDQPSLAADRLASAQIGPQCTLCMLVIRKLENMLPKNRTEETVVHLMGEVCDLLPSTYKDECNDFVDKYGEEIVEFLLSSVAPHSICVMLHLCLVKEASGVVTPPSSASECESCRVLAVLSRLHQGLNATGPQTAAFLRSVCLRHPHAVPKCDTFTNLHASQLQRVLGNQLDYPDTCERAGLCVRGKDVVPLGQNHCTFGPAYWCKDMKTAKHCGNVAFCKKYIWT